MRSDIYSLLVSGMRYFFVAAIVYILFRIVYHSVCEYNELRRVKNWLEKGYARHIEFLPPFDTNEEGFILAKSNIIGRGRKCADFLRGHQPSLGEKGSGRQPAPGSHPCRRRSLPAVLSSEFLSVTSPGSV